MIINGLINCKTIRIILLLLFFNFKFIYFCSAIKTRKTSYMKTLSTILVIAGLTTMVSCGPNAEQMAEQYRLDSIRVSDSITLVEADQLRIQDSIYLLMANDTTLVKGVTE